MSRDPNAGNIGAIPSHSTQGSASDIVVVRGESSGAEKPAEWFLRGADRSPSQQDQLDCCADWYTDWIQSLPRLAGSPPLRNSYLYCKPEPEQPVDGRTNEEAVHAR